MRTARHLIIAWVVAFSTAGTLVFPLLNPYYGGRVVLSFGLAGAVYGIESVFRAGHIQTCGFLSGNCTDHSVRSVGLLLWVACFVFLRVRDRDRPDADSGFPTTEPYDSDPPHQ